MPRHGKGRPAMQARAGFADVSGTRLYYEVAGAGRPLVLIHGFSLDSRLWDDQFAAFTRRHLVLRYDLRGFGRSAPPGGEPYAHADDLRALLEHLGVGPVVLLGLSLGGGIAIDFALEHLDLTGALIPVDAMLGGYRMSEAWDASVRPIWRRGRAGRIPGARLAMLPGVGHLPNLEGPERFNDTIAPFLDGL